MVRQPNLRVYLQRARYLEHGHVFHADVRRVHQVCGGLREQLARVAWRGGVVCAAETAPNLEGVLLRIQDYVQPLEEGEVTHKLKVRSPLCLTYSS
jgi:hypothetical protein